MIRTTHEALIFAAVLMISGQNRKRQRLDISHMAQAGKQNQKNLKKTIFSF